MAVIKYRESVGAQWQELAIAGDVEINAINYPDIWYNAKTTSNTTPSHYFAFDVTSASKFSFTYDYNAAKDSQYAAKCFLSVNYGSKIVDNTSTNAPAPKIEQVDANATSSIIFASLATDITGNKIELDVSNYTSIVLSFSTSYTPNTPSSYQYGYAHLYNIKLS